MAVLEYKGTIHKIIFFHIGWMEKYQGEEEISGPFGYINNSDNTPGEVYNFHPFEGKVYGYAPNTKAKQNDDYALKALDLTRLGAKDGETEISDVTVIFFSQRPRDIAPYFEEACIVGWYTNATLFKYPQRNKFLTGKGLKIGAEEAAYYATTDVSRAICLPINKRNLNIKSHYKIKGGYGQANVWYADDKDNSAILNEYLINILDYIHENKQPINHQIPSKTNSQWNLNLEERLKIEKIAVETTQKYFEAVGYSVISVEKEAKGWDLECKFDKTIWLVEVKGTKAQEAKFELTPNEYANLKKHISKYKISIVVNCLKEPKIIILSLQEDSKGEIFGYNRENNIKVTLTEKIAAIGRSSPLE